MFTKSKEILSNDVQVKQMMLKAIHHTCYTKHFFYEHNSMTKLSLKLIYYLVLFVCSILSALQIQFLVLLLTVVAKFILLRLNVTTQARRHGT